jgi:hypothetical protein
MHTALEIMGINGLTVLFACENVAVRLLFPLYHKCKPDNHVSSINIRSAMKYC